MDDWMVRIEVNGMDTIRCPKCDEKLMGKDEPSLSKEFRNHLMQTHKMNLPEAAVGKGQLAFGAATTVEGPKVEGAWGEEVHGKKHLEERKKAGKGEPQKNIELRCPVCGALIIGVDEDEISGLVKTHLTDHEHT
jgi:DNA-directed RNA polymerase subunit RPC12/RpoP